MVIVQGMEVNITLITINRVLGTLDGTPEGSFQELQLCPPYKAIRHTLIGVNSIAK